MRFFAHLVLLLRHLDQPLDEEQSNRIVKAYVQVLEMEGKDELVALYASELRTESAVETYAQYLLCKPITSSYSSSTHWATSRSSGALGRSADEESGVVENARSRT